MNAIKKLTATLLIVCMFFSLPQGEAEASETVDDVIAAAMNLNNTSIASHQTDCNGFYTMLSPCYKVNMNITLINSDGTNNYDTLSNDQSLMYDEDKTPVWHSEYNESEPPSVGLMISVLHF